MELLNNKLKKIIDELGSPNKGQHSGDKNIFYLTYPFQSILEIKKLTPSLVSLLKHSNYNVSMLSIGNIIYDFLKTNPRRANWLNFSNVEYKDEMNDFFKNLSSTIIENKIIENAILEKQDEIKNQKKPLLLLTDLEGIHPFTRFGPVEQSIYNSIEIPIIILYPGELSGSSLEFLGFYPPDGNYRSKHY